MYITQVPDGVTEEKVGELFGSIGVIKVLDLMSSFVCFSLG